MGAVPSVNSAGRERSGARFIVILFMALLIVLFVEMFATPYVVAVYSKGCWSVNTDGLFNHFNVRGCGSQSWLMIDLFGHVSSQPIPNGANDVSLFLSVGAGSGGGCVGGSACGLNNLWSYSPPSPIACHSCVVTQLGLPNPLADWANGGFATFPFVTWILLIYLAGAIWKAPKVYSGYLKGERSSLDWRSLSEQRRMLTTFSLGYLIFVTYQYIAMWVYLFIRPVPIPSLPVEGLIIIPVAIWLARFLRWRFVANGISYDSVMGSFGKARLGPTGPANFPLSSQPVPGRGSRKPVVLGIVLIAALVAGTVLGPPLYSYAATALAPRSNLQVTASPSAFTAIPGASSNTTILVKSLGGPATTVSLTVAQTPACNGACTVPLLQITLTQNSFDLSPGQTGSSTFMTDPYGWAGPGSYDFVVTATPGIGLAASALVTVHLAGFNLTASPSVLNFTKASFILSTITVNSVYGYAGTVSFSASTEAVGPVTSFSARSVNLPAGGFGSTTLNLTSQAQGSYDVWIYGRSGRLSQMIMLPVTTSPTSSLADFSLAATPGYARIAPGQNQLIAIKTSSVNGCICIVRLSASPTVSSSGPQPLIVTVLPNISVNSTLILMPGAYLNPGPITVTVTGTCGPLVHSVNITLDIT